MAINITLSSLSVIAWSCGYCNWVSKHQWILHFHQEK